MAFFLNAITLAYFFTNAGNVVFSNDGAPSHLLKLDLGFSRAFLLQCPWLCSRVRHNAVNSHQ